MNTAIFNTSKTNRTVWAPTILTRGGGYYVSFCLQLMVSSERAHFL